MRKKIMSLLLAMIVIVSVIPTGLAVEQLATLNLSADIYEKGQVRGNFQFTNSTFYNSAVVEMTDVSGNKLIYVDSLQIENKQTVNFDFMLRDWVKAGDYKLVLTCGTQKQSFTVSVKKKQNPNRNNNQTTSEDTKQEQVIVKKKENKAQKVVKTKPAKKQYVVAQGDVVTKKKGNKTVKSVPSFAIKAMLEQAKVADGKREVVIPVSLTGEKDFGIEVAVTDLEDVASAGLPMVLKADAVAFTIAPSTLKNVKGVLELDVAEVENSDGLKAFEFTMASIVDGVESPITTFEDDMEVALDIEGIAADPEFVRVFYVKADGSLEFMGGSLNADGQLVFKTNHFSEYIVKEERVSFADTQPEWAQHAVDVMASQHVIDGYDGKFHPNDNVTKAQFAKLIVEAMGYQTSEALTFTDVNEEDWFAPYLAKAVANGIITNGGTFAPNSPITREEMAIMLGNTVNYTESMTADECKSLMSAFSDLTSVTDGKCPIISKTINEGLMGGVGDGLFDPTGYANRAQAATVIYRLFEINK